MSVSPSGSRRAAGASSASSPEGFVPVLMALVAAQGAGEASLTADGIEKIVLSTVMSVSLEETAEAVQAPGATVFRRGLEDTLKALYKSRLVFPHGRAANRQWTVSELGVAHVVNHLLADHEVPDQASVNLDRKAPRVTEPQAALVLLARLAVHQPTPGRERDNPIATATLLPEVKRLLPLSVGDLAGLMNRKDTKIDQIIRNIIPHKVLETPGFIQAVDPAAARPKYVITTAGRMHLAKTLTEAMIPSVLVAPALAQDLGALRASVRNRALVSDGDRIIAEYLKAHPEEAEAVEAFRAEANRRARDGTLDEWAAGQAQVVSTTAPAPRRRRAAPAR